MGRGKRNRRVVGNRPSLSKLSQDNLVQSQSRQLHYGFGVAGLWANDHSGRRSAIWKSSAIDA